jgi:uncharacterized membrane protein YbhN (UPF0104 family)
VTAPDPIHDDDSRDTARLARPRFGVFALRALLTVGVLWLVLLNVPRDALAEALQRVSPALWALSLAGFLTGHAVSAGKWRLLVAAAGATPNARETLRAHAGGLFANLCLPSLVGGDVVRAGLLLRDGHAAAPVALGSIADRLIDTASVVTIAAAGALCIPGAVDATSRRVLAGSALLLAATLVTGIALARLVDPARLPGIAGRVLLRARGAVDAMLARPVAALSAFALSCAVQSAFVGISLGLGRAVGIELPASVWFLVSPLAKLTALLPVSLGGLGVREAAFVVLLAPFGIDAALAVAQSLLWQAVLVAGGLVAGATALGLGAFTRARTETNPRSTDPTGASECRRTPPRGDARRL